MSERHGIATAKEKGVSGIRGPASQPAVDL